MSGGSSAAPAGNTTTTTTNTPWGPQVPYLQGETSTSGNSNGTGQWFMPGQTIPGTNIAVPGAGGSAGTSNGTPYLGSLPAASALYQDYTPEYYPGSTVSPFTPAQVTGQSMEENMGLSGNPAVTNSTNFVSGLENGNYLTQGNPYQSALNSNILSSVVPSIESSFNGGNEMNSAGAAFAAGQGATSALAPDEYQNYQNTLTQMLQGSVAAPGLQTAGYQNAGAVEDVGQQQQTQNQAQLNNSVNEWNYNQELPYNELSTYDQLVNGTYGGTGTETTPYYGTSPSSELLAGGLGTSALGSALSGGTTSSLLGGLVGDAGSAASILGPLMILGGLL